MLLKHTKIVSQSLKGFKYQDKLNHCNNVYWLRMEHRWHYRNGIIKFYIILIKAINEYLEQIFNTLMETWQCLWHMFLFSKPIALGDKIWIVKLRYNGSVSLYSGCKHTFSYITYFERLESIWNHNMEFEMW